MTTMSPYLVPGGENTAEPPAAANDHTMAASLELIRSEYLEMPGLHLTKAQVQRLWGLDPAMCDAVMKHLEAIRFLRRTDTGAYVKA
jgi:hypothetical protein